MKALSLIAVAALPLASAAGAATLELEIITPSGQSYRTEQQLAATFESFSSGAIAGAATAREYQAIRCNGPWGAQKYRITLASGPGYALYAENDRLLLQLVEHSVISEDATIAAMSVHCIDTEPRPVIKSLVEIELERDSAESQQLRLANGYQVNYQYSP